jgi:hypothetical protein
VPLRICEPATRATDKEDYREDKALGWNSWPSVSTGKLRASLPCIGILVCIAQLAVAHDGAPHAASVQPVRLAQAKPGVDASDAESRPITVHLIDSVSGEPLFGLLRVLDEKGTRLALPGLLNRAAGISERSFGAAAYSHFSSWYVVPGEAQLALPEGQYTVEAFSGLESVLARKNLRVEQGGASELTIPVEKFMDRQKAGLIAGNVHLHLQRMAMDEAENYALAVAQADALDLAFFSYLERAEADEHYISNHFTRSDLERFHDRSGVQFGYGEEYRHNFHRHDGYGHVMFLDLWKPILPASFGPDITKQGNDDGVLRTGINQAHEADATVLWCHNTRGLEDIPNWLAGLLHGQIFFEQDGSPPNHKGLYSYLNIGLKVPISTGTDWFFRDMAMTYVLAHRPFTDKSWLTALRQGRSFMTNGPMLEFTVDGKDMGDSIALDGPATVTVAARAQGRVDFQQLELLHNGEVIHQVNSTDEKTFYDARIDREITIPSSGWLAIRIPPIQVDYNRPKSEAAVFNEYGKPLFAHSSPIYVNVGDKPVFVRSAAENLRGQVLLDKESIERLGQYSSEAEREKVLALYDEAIGKLDEMLTSK